MLNKHKHLNKYRFNLVKLIASRPLVSFITLGLIIGSAAVAHADYYQQQIDNLKAQNSQVQSSINSLQGEATTYQAAVNQLQTEAYLVQLQINANSAKQADLEQQINDNQAKIDLDKAYLASTIKAMYVDGTPSTIEQLATSNSLSDFVDKQEYRSKVQTNLNDLLTKIEALKKELQAQKVEVDQLVRDQTDQHNQLSSDLYQQDQLLNYNVSQQTQYTQQLQDNQSKIAILRAQQAAAYASATGANGRSPVGQPIQYTNMSPSQRGVGLDCGGGYEYCYYSDGSLTKLDDWVNDPFGFHLARECAHYVVDALHVRGYYVGVWPSGKGYAYNWVGYTTGAGLATLVSSPQPDDVVYIPIAPLGHVAIVDWINGDGTAHVSQFNWVSGQYNTMDLYLSSPGIQFLRFHR